MGAEVDGTETGLGRAAADHLLRLGVSPAASQAYLHLLGVGPTRASDLAKALGTSRDEAYRRMQALITEGFAWATLTAPVRYMASAPERLFRALHDQRSREVDAVRQEQQKLVPILHRIRRSADAMHAGVPFRAVNGRQRVVDQLHDMIDGALHELLVLTAHDQGARLAAESGVLGRLRQRAEVGVRVRLLLRDSATARRRGLEIQSPACQVRLLPRAEAASFTIADRRMMSFHAANDPSPYPSAPADCTVVTEAAPFIEMQRTLFAHLWDEAEPA